jgi:hypothetical protein
VKIIPPKILCAQCTADGPIKLEGMFEVGPPYRSTFTARQNFRPDHGAGGSATSKQEAISQPRQSAPVTGVANKSGGPRLSALITLLQAATRACQLRAQLRQLAKIISAEGRETAGAINTGDKIAIERATASSRILNR